jgi:hypothetical protein
MAGLVMVKTTHSRSDLIKILSGLIKKSRPFRRNLDIPTPTAFKKAAGEAAEPRQRWKHVHKNLTFEAV